MNIYFQIRSSSRPVRLRKGLQTLRSRTKTRLMLSGPSGALFPCGSGNYRLLFSCLAIDLHDVYFASGYTWTGFSCLLANAATAPVWGRFSDD
ncbi:hypothetical protein BDV97DRAFT_186923 [Delphinella strobiligena]|nr:hypothetical protein BDV97DRAFT_186923 [Delphinella strobiligena]